MSNEILIFSIFIYICIASLIEANFIQYTFCPRALYDNTKMNWFGCWFIFILIGILSPLVFSLKILAFVCVKVCMGIVWLFTVGRKD